MCEVNIAFDMFIGVQSSWGAAKKAVDLVTNGLRNTENDVIGSIVNDLWSKL